MKQLLITLAEPYVAAAQQVAGTLSDEGLVVEKIYPFGVIKGQADEAAIPRLRAHQAVQLIQEEQVVRLVKGEGEV